MATATPAASAASPASPASPAPDAMHVNASNEMPACRSQSPYITFEEGCTRSLHPDDEILDTDIESLKKLACALNRQVRAAQLLVHCTMETLHGPSFVEQLEEKCEKCFTKEQLVHAFGLHDTLKLADDKDQLQMPVERMFHTIMDDHLTHTGEWLANKKRDRGDACDRSAS